jgi:hemerythrin-like domain-containing protein
MKTKVRKKSARKATGRRRANAKKMAGGPRKEPANSALALLQEDHRQVQKIFRDFRRLAKDGAGDDDKRRMVMQACDMLTVHARIEEELFYPAMRRYADEDIMDEALVEHDSAKELIAQLLEMQPGDHLYDAKFTVLGEMVKHHIEEEESRIFQKARKSGIDLVGLGREMKYLKERYEDEGAEEEAPYSPGRDYDGPRQQEDGRYAR